MVTAEGAERMEKQLFDSISKDFLRTGGSVWRPGDEAYYRAFSAVQELRIYLQGKEG